MMPEITFDLDHLLEGVGSVYLDMFLPGGLIALIGLFIMWRTYRFSDRAVPVRISIHGSHQYTDYESDCDNSWLATKSAPVFVVDDGPYSGRRWKAQRWYGLFESRSGRNMSGLYNSATGEIRKSWRVRMRKFEGFALLFIGSLIALARAPAAP